MKKKIMTKHLCTFKDRLKLKKMLVITDLWGKYI